MGRYTTGIMTVNGAHTLSLKSLIDAGAIKKGQSAYGSMSWGKNSVGLKTVYNNIERYVELDYTITGPDGKAKPHCYKIHLAEVPSNLGKGNLLYFVCPYSALQVRKLYMAYGSEVWKARGAYRNRIYYPCQLSSHMSRYNDTYWRLERQIEQLKQQRRYYSYKGTATKKLRRLQRLEHLRDEYDTLRWGPWAMPLGLRNMVYKGIDISRPPVE